MALLVLRSVGFERMGKTKCATCAVAIKLLACLICFLTVLVNASHLFLKNVRLEKIKNTEGSAMSIGLLVV